MLLPDETLDPLGLSDLQLIQPQNGYRFSLDPILLCGFSGFADERMIVDLGCGNGVIPLLAAARSSAEQIVGIERQSQMVDRARRSVVLNRLQDRVEICAGDLRKITEHQPPQQADLVLTNPPFRTVVSGRLAKGDERAAARHELAGSLDDFLRAAAYLLKHGGRFCIVYLPERLAELLEKMRDYRLEPKRLRMVHSRPGENASLVLVEGRRSGKQGLTVETSLNIYDGDDYSVEVAAYYQ